jgi:tellurite resistance protein TehA-like permease
VLIVRFTRHKQTAESVSPAWLLPIVSSVVAAASGGVLATHLAPHSPTLARSTILVSYVVWGTGVPTAMFIITLWIYRASIHGIPPAGALPSVFLPLGPCGQGSFGILLLGKMARTLAYDYDLHMTIITGEAGRTIADAIYAGGLVTSLVLWGLGLVWYTLATAFFIDHFLKNRAYFGRKSFSIGFTALTFPIGVWATATTELATELNSPALRVIGTVISLQVVINWVYVFAMTCWKAYDGTVWVAPELSMFEGGRPKVRWAKQPVHSEV